MVRIGVLCMLLILPALLAGCQSLKTQDVGNTASPDFYTMRGPSGR